MVSGKYRCLSGGCAGHSDNASEMHWCSSIGTSFTGLAFTEYTLNVIKTHTLKKKLT